MSEYELCKKLKTGLLERYDNYDFDVSFTGTYRQVILHKRAREFQIPEYLNIDSANKNVSHFLNAASRRIFGCSRAKSGQRLFAVGYIEGYARASVSGRERIHCNLSIGGVPPERFNLFDSEQAHELERLLMQTWSKTKWGYKQSCIKVISPIINHQTVPTIDGKKWLRYSYKYYNHRQSGRMIYCLPKP